MLCHTLIARVLRLADRPHVELFVRVQDVRVALGPDNLALCVRFKI